MSEAADRARLRWELQEASWCWDNWVEEHMAQFGISERAAKLLHMGERVEDAMDFEASLYDRDDGGFPGLSWETIEMMYDVLLHFFCL